MGQYLGAYFGIKIIESINMIDRIQTFFPRSKKKRIRKKWKKMEKNYSSYPSKDFIQIQPDVWVCHPLMANELRRRI